MTKQEKQYWANYYGINLNLPDGEFWNQINKINHLALQKIENYNKFNHSKANTINHD